MKEILQTVDAEEMDEIRHDSPNRRAFLTHMAVAGMGVTALGLAASTEAFGTPAQSRTAANEMQFRMGVIGPAQLSLVTSQIAVDKARQANAKEFAGFELTEAISVTTVLKMLRTPMPAMDAKAQATLEKIRTAPQGAAFDRAYITAQHENHVFLRDLAESYLKNSSPNTTDMAEMHGQHLATLALATFKEHVAITARIMRELRA